MNNSVACVLAFIVGAAAGAAISWKLLKDRYEQISREEAEAFRKAISERKKSQNEEIKDSEDDTESDIDENDHIEKESNPKINLARFIVKEKPDLKDYAKILQKQGYYNEEGGPKMTDEPYVITPDEFGDNPDYETISLTYYSDGVLTDEFDEIITNIDDVVGMDSLNHFGEYEDDSVFVRNDDAMTDYEILLDERKYSESHGLQVDD